jgi:putative endonuclease
VTRDPGEVAAEAYFRSAGWSILERNWRAPGGEVDLIARDGDTLVFVEVKRRASGAFGGAAASVSGAKRRRLSRCAALYLRSERRDDPVRFDVFAIDNGVSRHIPGAFQAEGFTR